MAGKKYVEALLYCKDAQNNVYVAANKRGSSCKTAKHLWNVPTGQVEKYEVPLRAIMREVYEEVGLDLPMFRFSRVDERPKGEDMIITYRGFLSGSPATWPMSSEHADKDEVEEFAWVNIKNVNDYDWAFDQKKYITKHSPAIEL